MNWGKRTALAIACGAAMMAGAQCAFAQDEAPVDQTSDFAHGQADRQAYEQWSHSLSGDYLAGVSYWESHRSVHGAPGCDAPQSFVTGAAWTAGCEAARQRLTPTDQLRLSSPDYRRGWNSLRIQPAATSAELPPAVQPILPEPPSPAVNAPSAEPSPPQPAQPPPAVQDTTPVSPTAPPTTSPATPNASFGAVGILIVLGVLLGGAVLLLIYFLPTIIAFNKHKRNRGAIFALNLLLGWSFLGWVLALVWSLSEDTPSAMAV